jgi:hypothetical protein
VEEQQMDVNHQADQENIIKPKLSKKDIKVEKFKNNQLKCTQKNGIEGIDKSGFDYQ